VALYGGCVVTALLLHYSAALAFASFCVVVGWFALTRVIEPGHMKRLVVAQAAPAIVFVALYAWHLAAAIDSDLMGTALDTNGWLSRWLVSTPGEAWYSFATFQVFAMPPDFRGRAALLVLAALSLAAVRDRLVAVVLGSALAMALTASVLGVYPFGPSRHATWLIVFVVPALGWLVGHAVDSGARTARVQAATLLEGLVAGGPIERVFGPDLA
jgi:hypothetical protein